MNPIRHSLMPTNNTFTLRSSIFMAMLFPGMNTKSHTTLPPDLSPRSPRFNLFPFVLHTFQQQPGRRCNEFHGVTIGSQFSYPIWIPRRPNVRYHFIQKAFTPGFYWIYRTRKISDRGLIFKISESISRCCHQTGKVVCTKVCIVEW
jgi:hypothetical protein